MESLHIFFKELWYNQPDIVIGGSVTILVLFGIYIWLVIPKFLKKCMQRFHKNYLHTLQNNYLNIYVT